MRDLADTLASVSTPSKKEQEPNLDTKKTKNPPTETQIKKEKHQSPKNKKSSTKDKQFFVIEDGKIVESHASSKEKPPLALEIRMVENNSSFVGEPKRDQFDLQDPA